MAQRPAEDVEHVAESMASTTAQPLAHEAAASARTPRPRLGGGEGWEVKTTVTKIDDPASGGTRIVIDVYPEDLIGFWMSRSSPVCVYTDDFHHEIKSELSRMLATIIMAHEQATRPLMNAARP